MTDLAKVESHVPQTQTHAANSQEVLASDFLIPRIALMQGISPLVMERKAQLGDMVRSTTAQKLGDPDKPVRVVPLFVVNSWVNYEKTDDKPIYRGIEPRTAKNEDLPWDYTAEDGCERIRKKSIALFCLLPEDVAASAAEIKRARAEGDAPDLEKMLMPVVATFQSTSYKTAARPLATFLKTVQAAAQQVPGVVPFHYTVELSCLLTKNDKGSFYVYSLGKPKKLDVKNSAEDSAVYHAAFDLFKAFHGRSVKVDDEDVGESAMNTSAPAGDIA